MVSEEESTVRLQTVFFWTGMSSGQDIETTRYWQAYWLFTKFDGTSGLFERQSHDLCFGCATRKDRKKEQRVGLYTNCLGSVRALSESEDVKVLPWERINT